jgi:hypothetical protein
VLQPVACADAGVRLSLRRAQTLALRKHFDADSVTAFVKVRAARVCRRPRAPLLYAAPQPRPTCVRAARAQQRARCVPSWRVAGVRAREQQQP